MKQTKLFATRCLPSEPTEAAKILKKASRRNLAEAFVLLWGERDPEPVREFRFCERRWRFDLAWPDVRVAVEIDGGMFVRGGHNRGPQITKDHEKRNAAVLLGWRVLVYTTIDMNKRPVQVIEEIEAFVKSRVSHL
jgi:very-short-patch-repair endonuclease